MHPSIDPLSPKNMDLSSDAVSKIFKIFNIPTDKPLITQISRFDPWKDPEGVLRVFELVKEKIDKTESSIPICMTIETFHQVR
jgi:trehalose synthase